MDMNNIMKTLLTLFVLLFSSSVVAEKYICSYLFDGEEFSVKLEKISDYSYSFKMHYETEEYIIFFILVYHVITLLCVSETTGSIVFLICNIVCVRCRHNVTTIHVDRFFFCYLSFHYKLHDSVWNYGHLVR